MAATGYSTIEEGSKAGVLDFIDRSANRGVMPPRRISARLHVEHWEFASPSWQAICTTTA
ncbi:hypothetical protein [Mesorhizobium sp. LSJC264A00]|uniref:hypothetical protein n=1 Tax=unclassified Mesorhizobium TaxID=325217 RepID=UPI0003CE79EB|nr:hypothetical protein [Mesorhizobium sp. LSJC264A00]ESX23041.1 hypothetical protein X767_17835 [Mesorhizobium sp. LSJC264A00]